MRALILLLLALGCNGRHLVWVDEKNEIKITQSSKNDNVNGLYVTMDDGPNLINTPKVLSILKQHNLTATFFVEGINLDGKSEAAEERRQILKQIMNNGNVIGNHSYDHAQFTHLSSTKIAWEVDSTTELIKSITGQDVKLIRLPYGKTNVIVRKILDERNLTSIKWDIDCKEYARSEITHQLKTKEEVFNEFKYQFNILRNERGQKKIILLLHDSKRITPEVLPLILNYVEKL